MEQATRGQVVQAPAKVRPWKKPLVLALAFLLVLGGGFAASYSRILLLPRPIQSRIDLLPEANARSGTPNTGDSAAPPGAGEFQVVINQNPTIQAGSKSCNIQVENPESNHYALRLGLALNETGQSLCETHLIWQGRHLENVRLNQAFEPGEYALTATFELFDAEKNPAGALTLPIILRVVE